MKKIRLLLLLFFALPILQAKAQETTPEKTEPESLQKKLKLAEDSVKHIVQSFTKRMATIDSLQKSLKTTIDSVKEKMEKLDGKLVRFGVSIGYNHIFTDQLVNYQSASIDLKDTTLRLETMDPSSIKVSTSIIIVPFTNADWLQEARDNNRMKRRYIRNRNNEIFKQRVDKLTEAAPSSASKRDSIASSFPKVPGKKIFGIYMANIGLYLLQNLGLTANINILEFNKAQSNLAFNKSMEGGVGVCLRLYENIFVSYSNELYFSRQLRQNIKNYENQKLAIDGKTITSIDQLDVSNDNYYITRNIIASSLKVMIVF